MTTIANDSFTGTNGTNLAAHTLDTGGSWSAASGTATLNASNQATNTTNTAWYTTSTSASDVQIKLDINALAAGYTGIILRFQDSNNFIFCVVDKADFTPAQLTIWTRISGSSSLKANCAFVGVSATITVTAVGTSIILSDETNSCSATISNFSTQTTHGLYLAGGAGGVVDNFNVHNILSVTSTPGAVSQTNNGNGALAAWTNPTNAEVEDGAFATVSPVGGALTYYLLCTNYGFGSSILSDATIFGIQVGIKKQRVAIGSGAQALIDNTVQLLSGSGPLPVVGANKADITPWGTTLAFDFYGGMVDLWSWGSASAVNIIDPSFGVAVQADNSSANATTANIDVVNATIFYSPADIPTFFYPSCVPPRFQVPEVVCY